MSSNVVYMNESDFYIQMVGNGASMLCNGINGLSLVLFHSNKCDICTEFIPMFKTLPKMVIGCTFGMINVSSNKSIISLMKNTITPIKYVPLLIMYVDGKFYDVYNGPRTLESISTYIREVSQKVMEKIKFMGNKNRNNSGDKQGSGGSLNKKEEQKSAEDNAYNVDDESGPYETFESAYKQK